MQLRLLAVERLLFVLSVIIALLVSGCCTKCPKRGVEPAPPKYVTLYSCDNVDVLGGTPCHAPDNPEYMMIDIWEYVRPRLAIDMEFPAVVGSFNDPGNGVTLRVWSTKTVENEVWYQVQYQDKRGWISSGYAKPATR